MSNATRHFIGGNTYPIKDQLKALGCRWDKDSRSWYTEDAAIAEQAKALVGPTPIFNSPPPQDLGTTDPVALASKYGRAAVADAKVQSFTVHGLGKGDDGKPNGTIRLVRGKRYVQVARTSRRYYSRDMLEDFDMFDAEPGGSYQWDGVHVEPTDGERTSDEALVSAKKSKESAPKAWDAVIAKIDQPAQDRPPWASDATMVAKWYKPAMVHTGSYPVIHLSETEVYYHVPSYFACDWDYAAVHRVALLTAELKAEVLAAVEACRHHGFVKP